MILLIDKLVAGLVHDCCETTVTRATSSGGALCAAALIDDTDAFFVTGR
jgi:hypothetical protein